MRTFHCYLLVACLAILGSYPAGAQSDVPVVSRGIVFDCTPTHVWDGDGPVWCKEGPRLRLAGIAARELDGTCSAGHPCPRASGELARTALVRLLGNPIGIGRHGHILVSGPTLKCRSDGSAGGNRTASWCVSPKSGDINCAMVRGGWAARWDRYWKNHQC
jgi:endonuclease YncB( thermonuclease family)